MIGTSERIKTALASPLQDDETINPNAELVEVLASVGLSSNMSGGSIRFVGRDPIISSPWPLATMAGVALMGKAVAMANLWRLRTGEGQDLGLDLRRVLHRLCPFYDRKWELLNGYPPGNPADPSNPFTPNFMYPTRDGRWLQFINLYPRARSAMLAVLGCNDDFRAVTDIVRGWDGAALEERINRLGLQATLIRSAEEFMATEQYGYLANAPLIEITKIADTSPIPFVCDPATPLDGIKALGLGRVIAGAGLGRALAFHGADVLNIWGPDDFELDNVYATSHVGMRSSVIDIRQPADLSRFAALLEGADIFFSNRRPGFLTRYRLTAEELAERHRGLIHVEMSLFGWTGPWAGRIGFDQNASGVSGVLSREGTPERPSLTEILVVNDYAMSWIASMAVGAALARRATEGGSYRIRLSLTRLSMWLLHMGIFDKAYARAVAGTAGDHEYLPPELFTAETPCGSYQGVTDQVVMSRTNGFYRFPLVPKGSSKAQWLDG